MYLMTWTRIVREIHRRDLLPWCSANLRGIPWGRQAVVSQVRLLLLTLFIFDFSTTVDCMMTTEMNVGAIILVQLSA